jgi:hypothetical protein
LSLQEAYKSPIDPNVIEGLDILSDLNNPRVIERIKVYLNLIQSKTHFSSVRWSMEYALHILSTKKGMEHLSKWIKQIRKELENLVI